MHLNKKSLKQQGGQMIPMQPGMQNNQQPDPMIQKVTMMISESVKQGKDIVDVVTELSTQEIDQQVIAQALVAATKTVEIEKIPHSLHAYFIRPGSWKVPVLLEVERVRKS